MNTGLIDRNVFAFHMSHNPDEEKSELTFGFYDEARFMPGTMFWHPVVNPVFFALDLIDIRLGGVSLNLCGPTSSLGKVCTITPDSGTSMLSMPEWAITQLENEGHPQLGGTWDCEENDEFA